MISLREFLKKVCRFQNLFYICRDEELNVEQNASHNRRRTHHETALET